MLWRMEIQIDQIWPRAGDETSSTNGRNEPLHGRGGARPNPTHVRKRRGQPGEELALVCHRAKLAQIPGPQQQLRGVVRGGARRPVAACRDLVDRLPADRRSRPSFPRHSP